MRKLLLFLIACSVILTEISPVFAEPFQPRMNLPESYKDIRFGLSDARENIETVQCGGWARNTNATVNGERINGGDVPIPEISPDVPGRKNDDPLFKPPTGLGERSDFEYPDSAWGYSSSCDLYASEMQDQDLQALGLNITYDHDVGIDDDPNVRVEGGNGTIKINPGHWCTRMDKATPKWCKKLFETWQKMIAIAPRPIRCPAEEIPGCGKRIDKRYCFDPPYTFTCHGTSDKRSKVTTTFPDVPPQDTTCRTTWKPDFVNKVTQCFIDPNGNIIPLDCGEHRAVSSSYYRHYGEDYLVPKITVTAPTKTWQLRSECYEYYREEDPKEKVMSMDDEQCEIVIATSDEQAPDPPEWPDGDHEQKEEVKAPPDTVAEPPRDPRPTPEPWALDSDTNLSLIDMKKLKEIQGEASDPSDITGILSTILTVRQRGSKSIPDHARVDMLDDTNPEVEEHRDVSRFWEEQQRELIKMVADPAVRLLMPARFLVGLADDDPIFRYVRSVTTKSEGVVELTLRAGLDDLGAVLQSLERVYVAPIQEVRIPIVLPVSSEADISAKIFEWKTWQELEKRDAAKSGRTSQAGGADPLIAKLESYREKIRAARDLRGALPKYLTKLFETEERIRSFVADWYQQNTELLLRAAVKGEKRRELKELWRELQTLMLETDECQLVWCSNHRYSLPIYSLLDYPSGDDGWWGDQAPGANRNHEYAPRSLKELNYKQPKDQQFDFSNMKFPRDPFFIPVLWPVTVGLKLPAPPLLGVTPPSPDEFPDLPDLPSPDIFSSLPVPSVELPDPSLITIGDSPSVEPAIEMLQEWKEDVLEGMKEAYCRFQPSVMIPPDPKMERGKAEKIIHVENDLKERIGRLFARWLPNRKEDFAGRVTRLNEDGFKEGFLKCHEDVVCYFLPPEKTTTVTWQWFMPDGGVSYTPIADMVKQASLPESEEKNPYERATLPVLKRFFPDLEVPVLIDLPAQKP